MRIFAKLVATCVVLAAYVGASGMVAGAEGDGAPTAQIFVSGVLGTNDWYVSPVEAHIQGVDPDGGAVTCEYRLYEDDEWVVYDGVPVTLDSETGFGGWTISARCTGADGITGTETTRTVRMDRHAPEIEPLVIDGELGSGWYNGREGRPTMTVEALDFPAGVLRCEYAVDDGPFVVLEAVGGLNVWIDWTSKPVSLPDGDSTIHHRCDDDAGNRSDLLTTSVKVDATPPTITFDGNEGTYAADDVITIDCAATDATSGIATDTCDAADLMGTPAYEVIGTHVLEATATDVAGNTTNESATFTVEVDAAGAAAVIEDIIDDPELADSLAEKVDSIDTAPNENAKAGKCQALHNQISAQEGQSITSEEADVLRALIDEIC